MKRLALLITVLVLLSGASLAVAQEKAPENEELATLKKLVEMQEKRINKLTEELKEAREELERLRKEEPAQKQAQPEPVKKEPPESPAQPRIRGKITEVRMDSKMVLIDLGSANGLRSGDVLEVWRAGKKIGRVKVCVVVDEDLSNAEVVKAEIDFLPGDSVVGTAPVHKPPAKTEDSAKTAARDTTASSSTAQNPANGDTGQMLRRLETLEGLYADILKQVQRLQDRLEKYAGAQAEEAVRKSVPRAEPEVTKRPRTETLEAKIAEVKEKSVLLWAGTEKGVKVGDIFVIRRGDREVAKLKVIEVIKELCRTEIVSKNTPISRKDIAVLE